MKQRSVKISDDEIRAKYEAGLTLQAAAVELNVTVVTLWRRAKAINLAWKDNEKSDWHKPVNKFVLDDILEGKYPQYPTFKLHLRLLKEGRKEHRCEICGTTEWMNKPVPLQLDHIDGNPHNHVWSNLRLICPNCHAQTETYCGRNK
jgi:5-methylcytosine-specific restriction endonuclease McrA